jgi:hypothetical protein
LRAGGDVAHTMRSCSRLTRSLTGGGTGASPSRIDVQTASRSHASHNAMKSGDYATGLTKSLRTPVHVTSDRVPITTPAYRSARGVRE